MSETSPLTSITFVLYVAVVLLLAVLSHRMLKQRTFLGEYFLGSRQLSIWTLAFTFAATSVSGGSFIGFPSLIYSYGWILAFWIAGNMISPLCSMSIMGKRLNQVARKTGAITIPDLLRDRYESPALGLFTTCTIIFFTTANLVAQFKAGGIIVEETFNLGGRGGYLTGLLLFAGVVVLYTAYGGFRAVVWTDVIQGVVMVFGVLILLPVVLERAGGLESVHRKLLSSPPTVVTSIPGPNNDLAFLLDKSLPAAQRPLGVEYLVRESPNQGLEARIEPVGDGNAILRVLVPAPRSGQTGILASEIKRIVEQTPQTARLLKGVHFAFDNDGSGEVAAMPLSRFIPEQEFLTGPGRHPDGRPFHPLGLALSFFVMWSITNMGQPGLMVRLMAFRDSRSLNRATLIVTIYHALVYLPLVFLFVAARTMIPYLSREDSDKAMVLLATRVVAEEGIAYEVLAAVVVAATFAAVMSTVDSFLLLISSALVRDIYQRTLNPLASNRRMRVASYAATVCMGALVTFLATRRIDFLSYIVVFTSTGFASTFLFPMLLGLFWKGMTRQGAIWSMVGGFLISVSLFSPTLMGGRELYLFGLHPVLWSLSGSGLLAILASKLSGPPPPHLLKRYGFG